jgi:hypothetical protein
MGVRRRLSLIWPEIPALLHKHPLRLISPDQVMSRGPPPKLYQRRIDVR